MPDKTQKSYTFVNGNGDEQHAKQLTDSLVAGYKVINMLLNAKDTGSEKIILLMENSYFKPPCPNERLDDSCQANARAHECKNRYVAALPPPPFRILPRIR